MRCCSSGAWRLTIIKFPVVQLYNSTRFTCRLWSKAGQQILTFCPSFRHSVLTYSSDSKMGSKVSCIGVYLSTLKIVITISLVVLRKLLLSFLIQVHWWKVEKPPPVQVVIMECYMSMITTILLLDITTSNVLARRKKELTALREFLRLNPQLGKSVKHGKCRWVAIDHMTFPWSKNYRILWVIGLLAHHYQEQFTKACGHRLIVDSWRANTTQRTHNGTMQVVNWQPII